MCKKIISVYVRIKGHLHPLISGFDDALCIVPVLTYTTYLLLPPYRSMYISD